MIVYIIASAFIVYFVIRIAVEKRTENIKIAFAGAYDGNETVKSFPKERNKTIYTEGEDVVDLSEYDKFVISGRSLEKVGLNDGVFVYTQPLGDNNLYSICNRFVIFKYDNKRLLEEHPEMSKICTTWMDTITHRTRRGESEFGLSNTNKMIKWYNGLTGLKTGYTPQAKHCVSATATRDQMGLIAVIMGAADGKIRFQEAAQLLDYGFANYKVKVGPQIGTIIGQHPIKKGTQKQIDVATGETKSFVVPKSSAGSELTYEMQCNEALVAPIAKGETVGRIVYYLDGNEVGEGTLVSASDVKKATLKQMVPYMAKRFFKMA